MPTGSPPSTATPRPQPSRLRRWFNTWRRLDWHDRALLFEALILLGMGRATVLFIPFKRVAPHLGAAQQETPHGTPAPIAYRVGRAILLVSRHTPWTSNCFAQALAGHVMLRRRRAANTLYLGVKKEEATFAAHAWLRHGDLVVTGGPGHEQFTAMARYGWQPLQ